MGIIVAALFILLLLCFYFIALLNMKVNRFQKNERRQELLLEEMEASISSFLTEIEDENSRLIDSLKKSEVGMNQQVATNSLKPKKTNEAIEQQDNSKPEEIVKKNIVLHEQKEETAKEVVREETKNSLIERQVFNAPRAYVQNAYGSQTKEKMTKPVVAELRTDEQATEVETVLETAEERVKAMYMRGMSADEIARQLNRGKTEISLMLKFNNKTL